MLKAATADDSPYIKGLLNAAAALKDAAEAEKAETYINIWRAELNRDHIGKENSHHAEFTVYIPVLEDTAFDSKPEYSILLRISAEEGAGSKTSYENVSLEEFALPSLSEIHSNATKDLYSYVVTNSDMYRTLNNRAQELDRIKARNYARDPDNFPYGQGFSYFGNLGGDCANFVSQCYYTGEVETDSVWDMYTTAWKSAGGFRSQNYGIVDYMEDEGIVFDAGVGSWSRAFAGSIIYYPASMTTIAHVGIVTSNDGINAKYSAHTTDHCDENLTTSMKNACTYFIPCWDSYTNSWTPQ